ncbi:MAG: CGNR zinc finger domain-containing protein, partial [Nocardioidaceae bacterium]|nr:CGNR zinc finger domain-containing protein [Nocardioidaceae bacterium]
LAQADGSWPRLKTCRGRGCPCAFYDASRNNSRVWHDVHTCGNVANLRASRTRRRASVT